MRETSKCYPLRQAREDFQNYLRGQGIDIGCGEDCLRVESGSVRPWDLSDGDAQLLPRVPDEAFDFVYSSHCLEHLRNVEEALGNWVRILKPGGWLYLVVPDYCLYEKMVWPSRFNPDHKQTFSFFIPRAAVGRENHYHLQADLVPLLERLGMRQIRWMLEDAGFNYNLPPQQNEWVIGGSGRWPKAC
jgi:ubiquinone/menaquinone biosynthesis C-methylase UbiE